MITRKLESFLKTSKVSYEKIDHPETFTSQATAQIEHISGKQMAKVLIVKADEKDVMVMLPASCKLDLNKFREAVGAKKVRLESEQEFAPLFPDCEKGAMPPFGELYHLPLFADKSIAENDQIVFNGGSHHESIRMRYQDYEKTAHPRLVELALGG